MMPDVDLEVTFGGKLTSKRQTAPVRNSRDLQPVETFLDTHGRHISITQEGTHIH